MRLRLLVIALAVLAVVPAPASAASKPSCAVKGSKTVTKNKTARVFTVRSKREDYGDVLYGCLLSKGKRVRLAEDYDDGYVSSSSFDKVGLNGRFVVWQFTATDVSCKAACPPDYQPTTTHIAVRDLRGTSTKRYPGVAREGPLVTRSGTPAWLQDGAGGGVEVHAGTKVLDTGAIEKLVLDGNTLVWLKDGEQRSTAL